MYEIVELPPQQLGPLTPFYKIIVPQFKFSPWKLTFVLAFASSVLLYLFLGTTLVRLVSILQFGF